MWSITYTDNKDTLNVTSFTENEQIWILWFMVGCSTFLFNFNEISLNVLHIKEVIKRESHFETSCIHTNGKNITQSKGYKNITCYIWTIDFYHIYFILFNQHDTNVQLLSPEWMADCSPPNNIVTCLPTKKLLSVSK